MRLFPSLAWLVSLAAGVFLACGPDPGLYQGEEYTPERTTIPKGSPSDRDAACDGCGQGPDVIVIPLPEGGAEPSNTCETARAIGSLSADTISASLTANGTCSEWLKLRATENDNSALGVGMKVTLTLTPVVDDFDLYAYLDTGRDVVTCAAPFARSFNSGTAVETINLEWGEGSVANGSEDSRTIGIAVIKAGGPCTPGATFTLVAKGH
jgi:hypothetical protein